MENDNATLLDRHPDFLSLGELRRVCKIAPKSARYLIEHGIIPSIDTGKKTWRYKIATEDVATYLRLRDKVGSMIPPGAVSNRPLTKNSISNSNRKSFSHIVKPGQECVVAAYFEHIFSAYGEVLTIVDIAEMTGLDRSTVLKLARAGRIKSIEGRPKYLIPKKYLLEFVVTRRFLEAKSNSKHFLKILGGFEVWKTAKSSQ